MASGPEGGASTGTEVDPVSPAQSRAAHAYANRLLEPEVASAAAEDALAALRQTLATRPATDAQAPVSNETLLALTRLMTAVSLPDRSSPEDRRQAVWASIGSTSHCTCREAAALLATRANGNIQPREGVALDEHLAGCAECRELSVNAAAADAAFWQELTPRRGGGGGFGLASVPRAAYAVIALLILAGGGVLALTGGSSHSTSRAAVIPIPTQAVSTFTPTATVPTLTTARPAIHHHAVTRHAHPRVHTPAVKAKPVVHHTSTVHSTATTVAARTATVADATGTPATTAAASGSGSGSNQSAGATAATSRPAATHSAASPPVVASASGQSTLPADSAPQQGIGTLSSTTTTP